MKNGRGSNASSQRYLYIIVVMMILVSAFMLHIKSVNVMTPQPPKTASLEVFSTASIEEEKEQETSTTAVVETVSARLELFSKSCSKRNPDLWRYLLAPRGHRMAPAWLTPIQKDAVQNGSALINVGGSSPGWFTPQVTCMKGRTVYSAAANTPIEISHQRGKPTEVLPLTMFPGNELGLNNIKFEASGRRLFVIDACLSFYHLVLDVALGILPLMSPAASGSQSAPAAGSPRQVLLHESVDGDSEDDGPFVVLRSSCHVFHLGCALVALAFGPSRQLSFPSVTDKSFGATAKLFVAVSRQPPKVVTRAVDSDYEGSAGKQLVLSESAAICHCGAIIVGESQAHLPSKQELSHGMGNNWFSHFVVKASNKEKSVWKTCNSTDDVKVLLILRTHSRLIMNPQDFVKSFMSTTIPNATAGYCVEAYSFDHVPVLGQMKLMSTAEVIIAMHGASLTWLAAVPSMSEYFIPGMQRSRCRKIVVELWYYGKFKKAMAMYEQIARRYRFKYYRLHPSNVAFFEFKNSSAPPGRDRALKPVSVPIKFSLPVNAQKITDAKKIDQMKGSLNRMGFPHQLQGFFNQAAEFPLEGIQRVVASVTRDVIRCRFMLDDGTPEEKQLEAMN